jgi:hypothetical protein
MLKVFGQNVCRPSVFSPKNVETGQLPGKVDMLVELLLALFSTFFLSDDFVHLSLTHNYHPGVNFTNIL